jgi:beta-glucosidase
MAKPAVVSEYEPKVDAILAHFGVQAQALLEVISGAVEPSGLCPVQFPASMMAVERHCEDVPFDVECHVDADGNAYDVGFGLDWSGRIEDGRTERPSRQGE